MGNVENERRIEVGVMGCGDVAFTRYLPYLAGENPFLHVAACADLDEGRARRAAERFGLQAVSPEDLLAARDIDLVLNLTPPQMHEAVTEMALRSRKHVYSEKPPALSMQAGRRLSTVARECGKRLGCAPDTILGPNLQLARRLIDEGTIGRPFMASCSFVTADRSWHPNPEFFYQEGAGPILDEGPYFLSALVALLGPVREVTARAATYRPEMTITDGPRAGERFGVEIPTSYVGGLVMHSGVLVSMLMSLDVRGSTLPGLEIYGEEGTMRLAFPGFYNGPIRLGREHDHIDQVIEAGWETAVDDARGIGVEELCRSIREGVASRLEGSFPLHVLEVMLALIRAAETECGVVVESTTARPRPYRAEENPRNRFVRW